MSYQFLPIADTPRELNDALQQIADGQAELTSRLSDFIDFSAGNTVNPAYMVFRSISPTGPASLGAAWTPIDWYTAETPPKNIQTDLANGTFSLLQHGVYFINVNISFTNDELNAGRVTQVRVYDITDDEETVIAIVPTGRNQGATSVTAGVGLDIGPGGVNDVYRVEIGNGDNYTISEWHVSSITVFRISQYEGI